MRSFIVCVCLLMFHSCHAQSQRQLQYDSVVQQFKQQNADARVRPTPVNCPVRSCAETILIKMHVEHTQWLDERNAKITLILVQEWRDPRLVYTLPIGANNLFADSGVSLSPIDWSTQVWTPTVNILNAEEQSRSDARTVVDSDGTVHFSERITMQFACYPSKSYPLRDKKHCNIMLAPLSYPSDELILRWARWLTVTEVNALVEDTQDILRANNLRSCDFKEHRVAREHSCISAELVYDYGAGPIIGAYIMPSLLVFSSWLHFWIPMTDSTQMPRALFAIMPFHIFVLHAAHYQKTAFHEPTASAVWHTFCALITFASMMQFFLSIHNHNHKKQRNNRINNAEQPRPLSQATATTSSQRQSAIETVTDVSSMYGGRDSSIIQRTPSQSPKPNFDEYVFRLHRAYGGFHSRLDVTSKIVFPVVYVAFVIIYLWAFLVNS